MQAAPGATLNASHTQTTRPTTRRGGFLPLVAGLAALWVVLDQATKQWALSGLERGVTRPLLGELLQLRLVFNPGAAFSLGTGTTWVFTVLATLVTGAILWFSTRVVSPLWALALGLVAGGAAGNLVDRLVRAPGVGRGHVVDFLMLPHWPIFNVADIGVTCGAALIVLQALRGVEPTAQADETEATTRADQEERA
ncbi:signal peptidase II [Kytococcus schroeteri]|uniref:Lipoprotein signal peptidase n=1 Tax=Kytococcus schroeteri TaxID=138300 RepID=A0A2I1P861_9MICO|nr:lipoprotein signal peptidase [Kytococcus sp. HMSC28H12]PKZ40824.1 signal peptidase II [Kytococcus schroeteri]